MKRLIYITLVYFIPLSVIAKSEPNQFSKNLHFLENKGQVKDQYQNQRTDIDFKISSGALNVFIGNGELHYQFYEHGTIDANISMYRMDVVLLNANKNAQLIKHEKQQYYEHHYTSGNLAPSYSYSKITYKDIYPSIDWVLYIKDNQLEYDFVIHKGGNPADIKLQYNGANSLVINKDGSMAATTPMGMVTEQKPYSFQQDRKEVPTHFELNGNVVSFALSPYDGELTIDPTLIWGTYYGGSQMDYCTDVAVDPYSDIYMCGKTSSVNNIATVGAHQSGFGGWSYDAFLAKFDSTGARIWATYYGGSHNDEARSVTTDLNGNVFLSGFSRSYDAIATPGCHQPLLAADTGNAFLAKFDSAGARLWGTYYGGDFYNSRNQEIACDDAGNIYLSGTTSSTYNIATPGSHKDFHANPGTFPDAEGYLVKFDSDGVRQWGTYYGLDGVDDNINAICTDADGNVYVAGETGSPTGYSTPGSHQESAGSGGDAFMAKFNGNGERIWGTYYGGSLSDRAYGIDCKGSVLYLGGTTNSNNAIATNGTYQEFITNSADELFIAKFDTAGVRQWGSYFGGSGMDMASTGNMLISNDNDDVYICGCTYSTSGIALPGAHQSKISLMYDVIMAKFNTLGMAEWATYYGGCYQEQPYGIATDPNSNIYMTGIGGSLNNISTVGSYQYNSAGSDGFLARFTDAPTLPDTIAGDTSVCHGDIVTYTCTPVFWADSFTWILPGGWSGTSITNSIIATVAAPGGDIMVIAHKMCSNDTLPLFHVTVHALPTPVITLSGNTLSVSPAYVTYQWHNSAGAIPGATAQTYTLSGPDDYYVVVTDTNGCSGQSNTIPLAIYNIATTKNSFLLYPNPNNGNFTLSITGISDNEDVTIEITDITGRRIQSYTEQIVNGSLQKQISLDKSVSAGQYFLKLNSGVQNKVLMFTKY